MLEASSAFALVAVGVLFCFGILILSVASFMFAKATIGAHTARAHGAQADATERTLRETVDALDETDARFGRRPTRDRFTPNREPATPPEILEVIARQREMEREAYEHGNGVAHSEDDGRVTDTLSNDGIDSDLPVTDVGGRGDTYRQ